MKKNWKRKNKQKTELIIKTMYSLGARISNAVDKKRDTSKNMDQDNADKLEIKIQAEGRKRPLITYISPTDQLIALAFACAEEFKCDVDKVAIE